MSYRYPITAIPPLSDRRCPDHPDQPPIIVEGNGPHIAELVCADCERHLQWVGRSALIECEIAADLGGGGDRS